MTQTSPDDAARLPPSAIQRGLRLSIIEGMLSNIHVSITTGAFLTGFALLLGASSFELGVIGALPFVSQLFQFVGAYLEERTGQRRMLTVVSAGISRGLWAVIALLPFAGLPAPARLAIFLLVLVASQAAIGITANAWTSWMTDLVPARQRGRYFGTRNTIASVTAILSSWGAGVALDSLRQQQQDALGYAIIFGAAALAALVGVAVLTRQPEPPMRRIARVQVAELFSAPFRVRSFRTLSLLATGWALVTGIASPFFNAYGIQKLNLSFTILAQFAIATSAVAIVTQPYIGRLQDRLGNKTVLVGSMVGVILLPWGWVFSTPTNQIPLWLTSIFSGVFWPGITQGMVNLVMERAPAEGRGAFLAFYGAVTGLGTFAAGLLGGLIATALGPQLQLVVGGVTLTQYTLLFAASSVGRAIMALIYARRL
jgi:MFS family permease